MPKRPGRTLRAHWLGQQLRDLREGCGMTLKEAGDYLQRDPSMLSRFETADWPIRRGDVLALLDLYDVADEGRRGALIRLSEEVWQKGWWEQYADLQDQQFIDHPWLEARAERVSYYAAMIVPGLLQTQEYAERLIRQSAPSDMDESRIARAVEWRMQRQRVLDADDPIELSTVLDESVLRRPIGGAKLQRGQLAHLEDVARRPNVRIRVLPIGSGWHTGLDGSFQVYAMPEFYPQVAYVESLAGRIYLEDEEAERFARAYDGVWTAALDADDSIKLIAAAREEVE